MTLLGTVYDAAKSMLTGFRSASAPRNCTDAVATVEYDRTMFDRLVGDAPVLGEVIEELNDEHSYTEDLVRDILMGLYKQSPTVRPAADMDPSRLPNRAAVGALMDSPAVARARAYTVHDPYTSACATINVAGAAREALERHRQSIDDANAQAQQAADEAQQAADELEQALDDDDEQAAEQAASALADAQTSAQEAAHVQQATVDTVQATIEQAMSEALEDAADEADTERRMAAMWGVGPGELQQMSFDERAQLSSLLRNSRLAEFADLVGRMKMMAAGQQAKKIVEGHDDVVDVELSGDLSRIMPIDLSYAVVNPAMQLLFLLRVAERQLTTFTYEGTEYAGRGPVVCCIDSSASMGDGHMGVTREAWTKALGLALVDEAFRLGREFHGINFASRGQMEQFHVRSRDDRDVVELVSWVEKFFRGGTNFEEPLRTAVHAVEHAFDDTGRTSADIVFVTDGEYELPDSFLDWFRSEQERLGFRVYAILVGDDVYQEGLYQFADNVRSVLDLTDPTTVRDIFQTLAP